MNMSFTGLIRKAAVERRSTTARKLLAILGTRDRTAYDVKHRIAVCEHQIGKTVANTLRRFVEALKLRNPTMPHIIVTSEAGGWRTLPGGGHIRHMTHNAEF